MRLRPRSILLSCLLLSILAACTSHEDENFESQKFYFLESLKLVGTGGRQLQSAELDQATLTRSLATLDEGLKLAFQVERQFLDKLDLRLGKNYQRYFIKGVENYRLGIEAGDKAQQVRGLKLLQQWAAFWKAEQTAIQDRLHPG